MASTGIHRRVEANVRRIAESRGMSLLELSGAAGISRGQLYAFFNGDKDVTLGWLERMADVLEVDLAELLRPSERSRRG